MSFAPPGESSLDLLNEKSLLEGAIVSAAAYGVHLTIFFLTFRLLWQEPNKTRRTYFFLGYITSIFILGTLFVASSSVIAQYTFIDDRNFPGGPNAFAVDEFSIPLNLLGNVCAIVGTWFADSLLVWRGLVIYRGSRWVWVMAFPALVFAGSFVMSICLLVQISQPSLSLWSSLNFSVPYFSLSLSLNVLVAVLIVTRLLLERRKIVAALGKQHASQYVSIAAMIIESAALYSVFSLTFLGLYGANHPVQNIFLQVLPQIEFIAPLLIIYRVAQGRAWSSHTTSTIFSKSANLRFASSALTGTGTGTSHTMHTHTHPSSSSNSNLTSTQSGFGFGARGNGGSRSQFENEMQMNSYPMITKSVEFSVSRVGGDREDGDGDLKQASTSASASEEEFKRYDRV